MLPGDPATMTMAPKRTLFRHIWVMPRRDAGAIVMAAALLARSACRPAAGRIASSREASLTTRHAATGAPRGLTA